LTRKTASTGRKERKEKPPARELPAPPSPLSDLHLFAFSKKNQKEEQEEGGKKRLKMPAAWKSKTQAEVPLEPALLLEIWHEQNARSWWRARRKQRRRERPRGGRKENKN
jgi:hypothetical protein